MMPEPEALRQICILVEGQTEEQFINSVLQEVALQHGAWLTPIIVPTSTTREGARHRGGGDWKHYAKILRDLTSQPHWDKIGVMLDYYAYPRMAPEAGYAGVAHQVRDARVAGIRADVDDPRLIPNVQLHEFETLVMAAVLCGSLAVRQSSFEGELCAMVTRSIADAAGDLELVNNSPSTSPSHRIQGVWEGYDKAVDGVRIIGSADLDCIRLLCPTFDAWLKELIERG